MNNLRDDELQKEWRVMLLKKLDEIETDVKALKTDVFTRIEKITENFVTQKEFAPIKQLIYGGVATVLLGLLSAVIALVIKK